MRCFIALPCRSSLKVEQATKNFEEENFSFTQSQQFYLWFWNYQKNSQIATDLKNGGKPTWLVLQLILDFCGSRRKKNRKNSNKAQSQSLQSYWNEIAANPAWILIFSELTSKFGNWRNFENLWFPERPLIWQAHYSHLKLK